MIPRRPPLPLAELCRRADEIATELFWARAQVKRFVHAPKCPARDAVLWTWRRKVSRLASRLVRQKRRIKEYGQSKSGS